MQEGSITVQLSQSDHWAIKGLQGSWATDLEEFFAGSAIAIKDKTFGNAGFQAQYNSGNPRLYIGDGANEYLKFDGTNLSWKGAYSALGTDGKITCTGGAIGGWTIGATTLANSTNIILDASNKKISIKDATFGNDGIQLDYNAGNPRAYIGDGANEYLKFDGTNLSWKGAYSALGTDGKITCTGGTIGGFTLSSTTLANGTNIILDASNKAISINNATFAQAGIQLQYNAGTPRFYVGDGLTKWVKFDGTNLQLAEGEIKKVTLTDAITLGDGSTISGTITLNIASGFGDCYIAAGKTAFDNTQEGFILGVEDESDPVAKFFIGNTTDYLNWDGTNLSINVTSEDAIVVDAGGDIKLVADDANPGLLKFVGTSYISYIGPAADASGSILEIKPSTDDSMSFYIGSVAQRFNYINLNSSGELWIRSYHDASDYCGIYLEQDSEASGTVTIKLMHNGSAVWCEFVKSDTAQYFGPINTKEWDLGGSSNAWDDAYADDWNNVADFFYLDDRDDLATLAGIKGSGVTDERTGLELIDDNTLPDWMLVKDKNTGDVARDPDGKPYVSTKMFLSLLRGGLIQLNQKVEGLINARG